MFGALSSGCVGDGLLLPEELAALLGPDPPARLKSVFLLGATVRHRASSPPTDRHLETLTMRRALLSSPRSWMAQAATTRTITATPATIDSRSSLLRVAHG